MASGESSMMGHLRAPIRLPEKRKGGGVRGGRGVYMWVYREFDVVSLSVFLF